MPAQPIALDIPKAFDGVWHAGLFLKSKFYEISGQMFSLVMSFLSNWCLLVVLDGQSSEEYQVIAGVPQGVPQVSYYTFMTFLMIAINASDAFLYASDV